MFEYPVQNLNDVSTRAIGPARLVNNPSLDDPIAGIAILLDPKAPREAERELFTDRDDFLTKPKQEEIIVGEGFNKPIPPPLHRVRFAPKDLTIEPRPAGVPTSSSNPSETANTRLKPILRKPRPSFPEPPVSPLSLPLSWCTLI